MSHQGLALTKPFSQNHPLIRAQVAHTCNPSYLGGRDQEDGSSQAALASSLGDPTSKIPKHRKGLAGAQVCFLNSNPSTASPTKKVKGV
jgi:hypothetical protein